MPGFCGCGGKDGDDKPAKDAGKKEKKAKKQAQKRGEDRKKPPMPAKSAEGPQRAPKMAAAAAPKRSQAKVPGAKEPLLVPQTMEAEYATRVSRIAMKTADYEADVEHGGASSCSKKTSAASADIPRGLFPNAELPPAAADSQAPPAADAAEAPAGAVPPPSDAAADAEPAAPTAEAGAKPADTTARPTSPKTTASATTGFVLKGTVMTSVQPAGPEPSTSITSCSSAIRIGEYRSNESSLSLCSCPVYDVDIRRTHSTIREEDEPQPTRARKTANDRAGVAVVATETIAQRRYVYNVDVDLPDGVHPKSRSGPTDGVRSASAVRQGSQRYREFAPAPCSTVSPSTARAQGLPYSESKLAGAYLGQPQRDLRRQDDRSSKASKGGLLGKESRKQDVLVEPKCFSDHLTARRRRTSDTSSETKESQGLMEVGFECHRCKKRKVYWVCKACYKRNKIRYCNACKSLSRKAQESSEDTESLAKNTQPPAALASSQASGARPDRQGFASGQRPTQQPMYPLYQQGVIPQAIPSYPQIRPTSLPQMAPGVQPVPMLITVTCRSNAEIATCPNIVCPGQPPLVGYPCPPAGVCHFPPVGVIAPSNQPPPPYSQQPSPVRRARSDCTKRCEAPTGTVNSETSIEVRPGTQRDLVMDVEMKTPSLKARRARSETSTLRSVPTEVRSSEEVIVQMTETRPAGSRHDCANRPGGKSCDTKTSRSTSRKMARGSSLCGCGHDNRHCRANAGFTI